MKKNILLLILFLLFLNIAQAASNIGYVDFEYIYKNSPIVKKYVTQLEAKAQEVKKYNLETKNLMNAQKNEEVKNKIKSNRNQGLIKLEKEYIAIKNELDKTMTQKVKTASNIVLTQKKLDIIVDKRYTFAGGTDCTQEVFKAIK